MAQQAAYLSNIPEVFYFTALNGPEKVTYAIGPSYQRGKVTFTFDAISSLGAPEGAGIVQPISITAIRHQGTAGVAQVSYTFVDETAVNGVDYIGVNGTVIYQNDPITGRYDWRRELSARLGFVTTPKTFRVELAVISGGVQLDPHQQIQVTILPAPGPAGILGFTQSTQRQNPNTTVVLQVQRSNGAVGAVDVDFHTEDGTGVAGVDYVAATGQLSWANGDNADKQITVTLLGPATDKTFKVVLTDPTNGAVLGQIFETTVTVIGTGTAGDPGEIGFEYSIYQTPTGVTLSLRLKRTNGKSGAVSIDYQTADGTAIGGVDYTAEGPTTESWADQDDADKVIDVDILSPATVLNFFINLSNPTGGAAIEEGAGQATINILGGLTDPVNPLYDVFVDDFCQRQVSSDAVSENAVGYVRGDISVRTMEGEDGGVIGFDGGSSNNGNTLDYSNNDQSLLPSPPNRFSAKYVTLGSG